jgi:hypothetical protein
MPVRTKVRRRSALTGWRHQLTATPTPDGALAGHGVRDSQAMIATLRHRLLRVPARLVHHAGTLILRLPPGYELLDEVLARIRALPAPSSPGPPGPEHHPEPRHPRRRSGPRAARPSKPAEQDHSSTSKDHPSANRGFGLISAFTAGRTEHSRPGQAKHDRRCGLRTRLLDARSRAQLTGAARPLRRRRGCRNTGAGFEAAVLRRINVLPECRGSTVQSSPR